MIPETPFCTASGGGGDNDDDAVAVAVGGMKVVRETRGK